MIGSSVYTIWGKRTGIDLVLAVLLAGALILAFGFRPVAAQDEWPKFHHDLKNSGYSAYEAPETDRVSWTYRAGSAVKSPAVANGRVYVGIGKSLYCLDALYGDTVWTFPALGWVRCCPAVVDGKVYFGEANTDIGVSFVYCLDAATGVEDWRKILVGNIYQSSPAVADGYVYLGCLDNYVYCLYASSGGIKWSFPTGDFVQSSPAVADNSVYIGSKDDKVYCLRASDGYKHWEYDTHGSITSSPAVANGYVYIAANYPSHRVYCINASTGDSLWSVYLVDAGSSSPAVTGGKVYVGAGNVVYCLDAMTGGYEWGFSAGNDIYSSPAVADGKVYFGSTDDRVYCVDASSGTHIWNYMTDGDVNSSPAVARSRVYIGSADNKLYAFGPFPPRFEGVPATGEWGMIVLVVLLIGAGIVVLRQRRQATA